MADTLNLDSTTGPSGPGGRIAKLAKCPKSLYLLWDEYNVGFSGHKAARDFTRDERGKHRYNYYRRNVFWTKVSEMVRAGYTAERAIDRIYLAYGQRLSVTNILNKMIADKKFGGHPSLNDPIN